MKKNLLLLFFLLAISESVFAQKVNLYYDCQSNWKCNSFFDFIRTEVKMTNFVNDRFSSDVHLLITEQYTGAGGSKYLFNFLGQKRFLGQNDTLEVITNPQATDDEIRKDFAKTIQFGLFKYVLKTDFAQYLSVKFDAPSDSASNKKVEKDPWNLWVYRIGGSAGFDGDANYLNSQYYGNFSASRVTEAEKFSIWIGANKNINKYYIINDKTEKIDTILVENHGKNSYTEYTRSLGAHWSVGADLEMGQNTFRNYLISLELKPKVEYSVFPYKDFNAKRIVVGYAIGVESNKYYEKTIFKKDAETLGTHNAYVNASFTQKWGNINLGIDYDSYLHNRNLYKIGMGGAIECRIVKGLRFAVYGNYDILNNQIYLSEKNASRDDVITKGRAIKTKYTFNTGFGIRYQFGSQNNSAVNPRFNGLNYNISI